MYKFQVWQEYQHGDKSVKTYSTKTTKTKSQTFILISEHNYIFTYSFTVDVHSGEVSHYGQKLLISYTCQNSLNETRQWIIHTLMK
jgi:hypothetical protein